ncbi:MAG: hypothetical protein AUH41_12425 [Gemmatimonadetes bacterium 13_1_40CM_66_11]|nr:MAG: hypothetical protein AUH41_12425 [Gemmatimonadetes bacterium 13_1_40CM_66_11]
MAVLNGPNLNLLGEREPEIYGHTSLADIERATKERARTLGVECTWIQTNHEGELVEADPLLAVRVPFVEVHLSNIFAREPERRRSLLADLAVGVVTGFGADSYRLGFEALARYLESR